MTSFLPGSPPPLLVGREREVAVLRNHLSAALNGRGSVVLIGGEAGIGKTALAETLCSAAEGQGALVLTGYCYDLTETPPYGPFVELFDRCRHLDGIPPSPAAFAQRSTVGEVTSQAALFRDVLDFFTALAAQHPLVLLLDDLHWADTASLDVLRFLARHASAHSLLLIATYRADELTRHHPLYRLIPTLVREAGAERINLGSLDDAAVRTLVQEQYGMSDTDTARLVQYVQSRAEGNALFVGELLRSLMETGVLAQIGSVWRLGDLTGTSIPVLLRQVIDARVARLDGEHQTLLAVAAVVGQDIPITLYVAVTGTDEDALLTMVEAASTARLVEPTADGQGFRFVHALVREALYESQMPLRRARIHRRVADALLVQSQPDPDTLVYHLRQAHDPRLGHWLFVAGTRAWEALAQTTAVARYEEALPLLTEDALDRYLALLRLLGLRLFEPVSVAYGEEALRVAEELGDEVLVAYALMRQGHARALNGGIATGLAQQERAMATLVAHPDHPLRDAFQPAVPFNADAGRGTLGYTLAIVGRLHEARTLLYAGDTVGNGYSALIICEALRGQPEVARAVLRGALGGLLSTDARNVGNLLALDLVFVAIPYHADDAAEVRRVATTVEEAFAQVGEVVLGFPPRSVWHEVLILQGAWDEAWSFVPLARRLTRTLLAGVVTSSRVGMLARARGDKALAWALVREVFPDGAGSEPGTLPLQHALRMQETAAVLALDENDLDTARAWSEAHTRWVTWADSVPGRAEGQVLWAQYYQQAGDHAQAYAHAQQALIAATAPRQPLALLAAHRILGELDIDAGRYETAAHHLAASLQLAVACEAPWERAQTLLALAQVRVATGDIGAAQLLVDEVRAICEPLGATLALARADALSTHFAAASASTLTYPAGLSAREVEVLRLVADGLSNPQVGERLFLSHRTIEQHLHNIFNKTGVSSRAAAARWAAEQGIT